MSIKIKFISIKSSGNYTETVKATWYLLALQCSLLTQRTKGNNNLLEV